MKKLRLLFLVALLAVSLFSSNRVQAAGQEMLFFWAEGCPHCAAEGAFLGKLMGDNPNLVLKKYEVSRDRENQQLLVDWSKKLGFEVNGVPVTIIGDQYVTGYLEGVTDKKIEEMLQTADAASIEGEICRVDDPCGDSTSNHALNLPLLGRVETKDLSLPALSVVLGALDGFNPCAMWTLLFLISLLLGMKDRKRMWILGLAFIIASAAVYFVFMSAWLNLLLFIGLIGAVRLIIGLVALGGGVYSIKEFWTNRDGGCKVAGNEKKREIFKKIKKIVHDRSFAAALAGIILLAFAVNLVELICSAGLPAVYTQVLAMSSLSAWQYYVYILFYIVFFMLDDLIVFFAAMITLQLTGLTTRYTRVSRLVGGILMVAIGLILIFNPSLLMMG